MTAEKESTTRSVFNAMLDRIRSAQWPAGKPIPSERDLVEEFKVSRIAVRESLSMLRALGVLKTSPKRRSVVRKMDAEVIGRLFPLMLSLEGEQTYRQIFEIRLALEPRSAYLAALNRTDEHLDKLSALLEALGCHIETDQEKFIETDLAFHLQIAQATGNPLLPLLLKALSGFVSYVQLQSCRNNPISRRGALQHHRAIAEAIHDSDAERARVEMESHLRSTAGRMLKTGMLETLIPPDTHRQLA
jgi:DNA-binding FadR family transcriptional regulator